MRINTLLAFLLTRKNQPNVMQSIQKKNESLCSCYMFTLSPGDRLAPFTEEEIPTYQLEKNGEVPTNQPRNNWEVSPCQPGRFRQINRTITGESLYIKRRILGSTDKPTGE
jgi:hypothetical protein